MIGAPLGRKEGLEVSKKEKNFAINGLCSVLWLIAGAVYAENVPDGEYSFRKIRIKNGSCAQGVSQASPTLSKYLELRYEFMDWLGHKPQSFLITEIEIVTKPNDPTAYHYKVVVRNQLAKEEFSRFAEMFLEEHGLTMAIEVEGGQNTHSIQNREDWHRWYPRRSSLGYALPDRLAEFASLLMNNNQHIDPKDILYIETDSRFQLHVFVPEKKQSQERDTLTRTILDTLKDMPCQIRVRTDVQNSSLHETLLDRTSPELLHALRTSDPNRPLELVLTMRRENSIPYFLPEIGKLADVSVYRSTEMEAASDGDNLSIRVDAPPVAIMKFYSWFSIKNIRLLSEAP